MAVLNASARVAWAGASSRIWLNFCARLTCKRVGSVRPQLCICAAPRSSRITASQVGFWAHMQVATGARTFAPSSHLVFMTALMAFFSVVIALFKDIPDVRGDAQHDTATASVRYGVRRVFWACVWMLNAAYASAVAYIATHTSGVVRLAGLAAQIVMCLLLQRRAHMTDLDWHEDVVSAYMFVWKLFYAQYLVFPCLC